MIALGVFLHGLGGLAAGSFYLPFRKVRGWAWESYWLVGGFFSWIISPWVVAVLTVPKLGEILSAAPMQSIVWCYVFGLLWGVGGLTFGLSMRYLGLSLGYALALGFCATFGTIVPPIYAGTFVDLLTKTSGRITLMGIPICLAGIILCAWAGVRKQRELTEEVKTESIQEFNLIKGIWVAVFAGLMSACMAFAIASGKPIAALAVEQGTPSLWQNGPVLVVVLLGGFTTNFIWTVYLNIRNRTGRDYVKKGETPLIANYLFSAMAGITWYLQFMFYGMGTTKMGAYDFSSWTIHMSFIIAFSNLWGLRLGEWQGCHRKTLGAVVTGIGVVVLSTIIIGWGNYLAAKGL